MIGARSLPESRKIVTYDSSVSHIRGELSVENPVITVEHLKAMIFDNHKSDFIIDFSIESSEELQLATCTDYTELRNIKNGEIIKDFPVYVSVSWKEIDALKNKKRHIEPMPIPAPVPMHIPIPIQIAIPLEEVKNKISQPEEKKEDKVDEKVEAKKEDYSEFPVHMQFNLEHEPPKYSFGVLNSSQDSLNYLNARVSHLVGAGVTDFLPEPLLACDDKPQTEETKKERVEAENIEKALKSDKTEKAKEIFQNARETIAYPKYLTNEIYVQDPIRYTILSVSKMTSGKFLFRKDIEEEVEKISTLEIYKPILGSETLNDAAKSMAEAIHDSMILTLSNESDTSALVLDSLRKAILPLRNDPKFKNIGISGQKAFTKTSTKIIPDFIVSDEEQKYTLLTIEVKFHGRVTKDSLTQHAEQLKAALNEEKRANCIYGILTTFKRWIFTSMKNGRQQPFMSCCNIEDKDHLSQIDMLRRVAMFIRGLILKAYEAKLK